MKTQSFKLLELLQLEVELSGIIDQKTGKQLFNGLLSQKLSLTTKYWLNGLVDTLLAEKKVIDSLRDELIKKYGDEDANGNIGISVQIPTGDTDNEGNNIMQPNPKYFEFNNEYNTLLNESKEIKVPTIKFSELEKIETEENYKLVLKYLVEESVEETE